MEIKEKQIIPAKEEWKTIAVQCDSCKKDYKNADKFGESVEWEFKDGPYDKEVTTKMSISTIIETSYSEYMGSTSFSVDICPDCFITKVIPFLKLINVDVSNAPEGY